MFYRTDRAHRPGTAAPTQSPPAWSALDHGDGLRRAEPNAATSVVLQCRGHFPLVECGEPVVVQRKQCRVDEVALTMTGALESRNADFQRSSYRNRGGLRSAGSRGPPPSLPRWG